MCSIFNYTDRIRKLSLASPIKNRLRLILEDTLIVTIWAYVQNVLLIRA